MQNPFMSAAFKPDLAFTGAAERFFELLKSFSLPGAGTAGAAPDWSALAGSLAGQFEQWLKSSQSAGPWFTAASAPGSGAGFGPAATGRKEEFCRLQAQLANASAALLVEQRRHAETLVRAFGLPSRNEVDALYAQLKELRTQLAELTEARRARPPQPDRATAGRGAGKRPASAPGRDRRSRRARKPRA